MKRRASAAGLLLLLLAGVLFGQPEHPHDWWERIPGFAAVLGFAGCWLIVVASKALGRHWLEKPEDYYDSVVPGDGEGGVGREGEGRPGR